MADENEFGTDDEQDDAAAVAEAAYEVVALKGAGRTLQVVAIIASLVWAVAVVAVFWTMWDSTSGGMGGITSGGIDHNRVVQVVATTLQGTWGYALVAVLAYVGATLVRAQSLRLLVAAMRDD